MNEPDNLREELHRILRAANRIRSPSPAHEFLDEFLDVGFYFLHAVKCWSAAKFPGFGRKATRRERRERGEPLLKACVKTHLAGELAAVDPRNICALGELAYCALCVLDERLDPGARPTDGRVFQMGSRDLLYTCFPSGSPVPDRPARDYTANHIGAFLAYVDSKKSENRA